MRIFKRRQFIKQSIGCQEYLKHSFCSRTIVQNLFMFAENPYFDKMLFLVGQHSRDDSHMNNLSILNPQKKSDWEIIFEVFSEWIDKHKSMFESGLTPSSTIKTLLFLALLDANKACNYEDIKHILKLKGIIKGIVPDNTLRTAMLHLGKTLDKIHHSLELRSSRGRFQLEQRISKPTISSLPKENSFPDPVVLLLEPYPITAEKIARDLIEKAALPFHALYFLEWSARSWEIFSSREAEIRAPYESGAWEKLGIRDRLLRSSKNIMGFVGLAIGEGLAEIELLRKILSENSQLKIHYIAIDTSHRLLRNHISLLKETLSNEIESGQLVCAGVIGNIFSDIREAIQRARNEFYHRKILDSEYEFLPSDCSLLITYFGNCIGNHHQDQETELFFIIHSIFRNRPLDFLVGASVMRSIPDEYKRNPNNFLLQTPKYLLEIKKVLTSSRSSESQDLVEFSLPKSGNSNRCPPVIADHYHARHQIEGQVYRCYYRLAYDLKLTPASTRDVRSLPDSTLILLYNVIKYKMKTLVAGIEKCGLFKISYDENYHQIIDSPNGTREYAVFSAFSKK